MMEPEDLIFDGGIHPTHERVKPSELLANLQWFALNWRKLRLGGVLATSACAYIKTETGFRRVPPQGAVPTPEQKDDHIA